MDEGDAPGKNRTCARFRKALDGELQNRMVERKSCGQRTPRDSPCDSRLLACSPRWRPVTVAESG